MHQENENKVLVQILIGVVSSDVRLAVRSLRDYVSALGLPYVLPQSKVILYRHS